MHLAVLRTIPKGWLRTRRFSRWKHIGFMTRIHSRAAEYAHVVPQAPVCICACIFFLSYPTVSYGMSRRLRGSFFDASVSRRRGALSAFCGSLRYVVAIYIESNEGETRVSQEKKNAISVVVSSHFPRQLSEVLDRFSISVRYASKYSLIHLFINLYVKIIR